jgi:hypothetical protein
MELRSACDPHIEHLSLSLYISNLYMCIYRGREGGRERGVGGGLRGARNPRGAQAAALLEGMSQDQGTAVLGAIKGINPSEASLPYFSTGIRSLLSKKM